MFYFTRDRRIDYITAINLKRKFFPDHELGDGSFRVVTRIIRVNSSEPANVQLKF